MQHKQFERIAKALLIARQVSGANDPTFGEFVGQVALALSEIELGRFDYQKFESDAWGRKSC